MGTRPAVAERCLHKLSTGCALTLPLCCACADRRLHTSSYAVYVDGLGFVQRGTRWQSYCWPCKEFWHRRISALGIPLSQTRIPDFPEFTLDTPPAVEPVQPIEPVEPVQSQPIEDFLDQLLMETADEGDPVAPAELDASSPALDRPAAASPDADADPDAEITLAAIAAVAADIDAIAAAAAATTPSAANISLPGMQRHQDPEHDQQPHEAQHQTPPLYNPAFNIQTPTPLRPSTRQLVQERQLVRQIGEILSTVNRLAENARDSPRLAPSRTRNRSGQRMAPLPLPINPSIPSSRATPSFSSDRHLGGSSSSSSSSAENLERMRRERQAFRERRAENFTRVFGSREDVQREDYQSPIAGMYNRAWERFQRAEEHRRDHTNVGAAGSAEDGQPNGTSEPTRFAEDWRSRHLAVDPLYELFGIGRGREAALAAAAQHVAEQTAAEHEEPKTLDSGDRPEPMTDEQMMINMQCQVCYQLPADTAVLPCGHMVMCRWCADVVVPVRQNDHTIPAMPSCKCPKCRQRIKKRVRIHYG